MTSANIRHIGDINFEISGVLDFDSVPSLMREMESVLSNIPSANISFSGVTQCNSAGLALLLEAARLMQGKKIQFTQISEQMSVFAQAYGVSEELKELGLNQ